MTPITPVVASRLEKAAVDNGFDRQLASENGWLAFASTQCPLRLWLKATSSGALGAAFSQRNVGAALTESRTALNERLPPGAAAACAVPDVPALHHLVRRAFQLGNALPDELLHRFEHATRALPRTTEAERLVVQRVGQDIFRAGLMEYWDGRCALTGLAIPELLRASHIKPWADCATDAERLDVYNGFLLAAHLDALFDSCLMTIGTDGVAVFARSLDTTVRTQLALTGTLRIERLTRDHAHYLAWHRRKFDEKAKATTA